MKITKKRDRDRKGGVVVMSLIKLTNFYHYQHLWNAAHKDVKPTHWWSTPTDPLTNISEVNRNTIRKICYMPKIGKTQLVSIISFPKTKHMQNTTKIRVSS